MISKEISKERGNDAERTDLSFYVVQIIRKLNGERKLPAAHVYLSTLHSFARFSGGRELPMEGVFTPGRLKEYEEWLLLRQLSLATVSTYLRTLRAIYNRWSLPGSANHNPRLFEGVYTKVVPRTKRALTVSQMQCLYEAGSDGRLTESRKRVLAYFVLMFLLRGMPFVDLAHLRKCDVQNGCMVYCRHKTGRQIVLRIPREAQWLINAYKDENPSSVYLFPILDAGLRDVQERYRCYQKALRRFNRGLCALSRILLPGVKVSSYTARHTWATLAFHRGTLVGLISQALGHSSVRVTETYLKPFEDKRLDDVNRKLISSVIKYKRGNDADYSVL